MLLPAVVAVGAAVALPAPAGAQRLVGPAGVSGAPGPVVTAPSADMPRHQLGPAAPVPWTRSGATVAQEVSKRGRRTVQFVVLGGLAGGVVGAMIGKANALDCEKAGCVGYSDITDFAAALKGVLIGVPVGALAGYVLARATEREDW